MKDNKLYIVVPCYNESEVLLETDKRLNSIMTGLIKSELISSQSKILYVDDGSSDNTWDIIMQCHATSPYSSGVKLAGNTGHQNALMAGMSYAKERADMMVTIDADLQDDVEVIADMVHKYHEGFDIVYGVRKRRNTDTFFKRNTALCFYKLMNWLGVKSVYNHADFRLMSRRAVEFLCKFRERNLFLRGIVPLVGYKSAKVYYDRAERYAGQSKYPLSKMMNFALDGITSFSVKPLRMVLYLGMFFILLSFAMFVWVLISYLSNQTASGWASLVLSIWFIGGCSLVGVGVLGEYIGKIYIEVKDRPRFNIEEVLIKSEEVQA